MKCWWYCVYCKVCRQKYMMMALRVAMQEISLSVCGDGWFNPLHPDYSMCNRCHPAPDSSLTRARWGGLNHHPPHTLHWAVCEYWVCDNYCLSQTLFTAFNIVIDVGLMKSLCGRDTLGCECSVQLVFLAGFWGALSQCYMTQRENLSGLQTNGQQLHPFPLAPLREG